MIDAAARAEQLTGRQTLGIAVSGSTAQRLGQDSPALAGQTLTLDALVARVEHGALHVDEAHDDLLRRGGDGRHLPPRPAHRDRRAHAARSSSRSATARSSRRSAPAACSTASPTSRRAPSSRTCVARSTRDEQRAWADLRAGRSDRAMAHYLANGRLHMADTRDEAVEQAVRDWAALTETHPIERGRADLRRIQQGDRAA